RTDAERVEEVGDEPDDEIERRRHWLWSSGAAFRRDAPRFDDPADEKERAARDERADQSPDEGHAMGAFLSAGITQRGYSTAREGCHGRPGRHVRPLRSARGSRRDGSADGLWAPRRRLVRALRR